MKLDKNFIKKLIPKAEFFGGPLPLDPFFSLDSRTIKPGEIFVAITGSSVDGHDYIEHACKNGAAAVIASCDKKSVFENMMLFFQEVCFVVVDDPRDALIRLAIAWRMQFDGPVIGITGSVGKTTTKEMVGNILQAHNIKGLFSEGNQNTILGVALTMLRIREDHQVVVMEMGVSKRGEMARMVDVVKPTSAVITFLGHSHMEGLGSLQDIAVEKRSIFKNFKEDNIGIIFGDQPILSHVSYAHPTIKFGYKTTNQIQARKIQSTYEYTEFTLKLYKERYKVVLKTSHEGRVLNALAAAAVGHLLGVPGETIVRGIEMPLKVPHRFEQKNLRDKKGVIIDDAYNANPESMKAALLAFERLESKGAKIAVLGDMLELGVNGPFWHRQLGRFLRKVPSLDHVVLVGDMVKWTSSTIPSSITVDLVPTWKEAVSKVNERVEQDSVILVKGSNGMKLYNLVDEISDIHI